MPQRGGKAKDDLVRSLSGPTPPLRISEPTPQELALDEALLADLNAFNDTTKAAETRKKIPQWIEVQFRAEYGGSSDDFVAAMLFGSCALEVEMLSSDLDVSLVVSSAFKLTPRQFLETFPLRLKRAGAQNVMTVIDARVPLIKLDVLGISVDLAFTIITPPSNVRTLSKAEFVTLLSNDSIIIEYETYNSCSGILTAVEIIERVPHKETFRAVLRAVKIWAMRRGVYGNLYSLFSGVVCAILVARACQLVPSRCAFVVLRAFFQLYSRLLQNHANIKPITIGNTSDTLPRTNANSSNSLLIVADPVFPYPNKAFGIGRTGIEAFYAEVTKANDCFTQFLTGTQSDNKEKPWRRAWSAASWSSDSCGKVLILEIGASKHSKRVCSDEVLSSMFLRYAGYVESKMRYLVYGLEAVTVPIATGGVARLCVRPYPQRLNDERGSRRHTAFYAFGVSFASESNPDAPTKEVLYHHIQKAVCDFKDLLVRWSATSDMSGRLDEGMADPRFRVEGRTGEKRPLDDGVGGKRKRCVEDVGRDPDE